MRAIAVAVLLGLVVLAAKADAQGDAAESPTFQSCAEQCAPFFWRGCGRAVKHRQGLAGERRDLRAYSRCVKLTIEECLAGFPLLPGLCQ